MTNPLYQSVDETGFVFFNKAALNVWALGESFIGPIHPALIKLFDQTLAEMQETSGFSRSEVAKAAQDEAQQVIEAAYYAPGGEYEDDLRHSGFWLEPDWEDEVPFEDEEEEEEEVDLTTDPYFCFNMGLEESDAQRAARLQADRELDEHYGKQADAYIAAMMDAESAHEAREDRSLGQRINAALTNWAY
jgi:hypothetical protein